MCNLALVYPSDGRQADRALSLWLLQASCSVQGPEDAAVGTDRAGSSSQDPRPPLVLGRVLSAHGNLGLSQEQEGRALPKALSDRDEDTGLAACSSSASGCWPGSATDCGPPPLRAGKGSQGSLQAVSKCLPKRRLELSWSGAPCGGLSGVDWAGGPPAGSEERASS